MADQMNSIFSLIYLSDCRIDDINPLFKHRLKHIALDSTRSNMLNNITGFLLYFDNHFIQVLEGSMDRVLATYSKIEQSSFHTNCRIVDCKHRSKRDFKTWTLESSIEMLCSREDNIAQKYNFLKRFVGDSDDRATLIRDIMVSICQQLELNGTLQQEMMTA
jgi:hypothetical protein